MSSHHGDPKEQESETTQREQPTTDQKHPFALQPPEEQPGPPLQEPVAEDEPGSITLFRVPTFTVHAFTSRSRMNAQQDAKAGSFLKRIGWASAERRRLVDADTHILPRVEITSASRRGEIPLPAWLEGIAVALFLGATLVAQALSLFTYPAYTSDEGNYMANAWAILQGRLAAYTFTYSHPPLGWIQLATWTELTGGITSFGNSINSGRVFMQVLAMASSLLLYLIARQLSGSRSAAFLALVIYTLSPLSLLYRHEVLLENIGTFWLLLALCLIANGKSRLASTALAAVALGIAILSKGVFLIFLPVMLYAVRLYATRFQRKFSLIAFLYIVLALVSVYALFALLKGELLPASAPSGGTTPHASLLATFLQTFQAPGPQAPFRESWGTWMQVDPILVTTGLIAMFLNILGGIVNRVRLLVALFTVSFCFFWLSSGTVYAFAILPLLPLLALNIVLALDHLLRWLTGRVSFRLVPALLLFILIGALIPAGLQNSWSLTAQNQTASQQEAMWWIGDHVSRDAVVITNSYLYTDLHDPQDVDRESKDPFTHAQIYTDAALDPAIAAGELKQDWRRIDFLVVDRSLLQTIQLDKRYFLLDEALQHAVLRAEFGSSANGTLLEIYQVIHT